MYIDRALKIGIIASNHGKKLNFFSECLTDAIEQMGKLSPQERKTLKKTYLAEFNFETQCREMLNG